MDSVDWEALIFTSMNVGESPKHARTSFAHMNAESIYSNQNSCNQTCEAACLKNLQRKWFLRASIYFGGIDNASPASRRATDMQWKVIGSEKHVFHWHSDFYSVSKRRVPNGPDPIHNRRVENSKQPPVRA
ncbi:CLAVATA3/ESR (CLE)-related protein 25, partial [Cucurbita argyrosperma subsp. sororia]